MCPARSLGTLTEATSDGRWLTVAGTAAATLAPCYSNGEILLAPAAIECVDQHRVCRSIVPVRCIVKPSTGIAACLHAFAGELMSFRIAASHYKVLEQGKRHQSR